MVDYVYSLSADFINGIDVPQLDAEIRNDPAITEFLLSITVDEPNDTVTITFLSALSPSEEIELDNIVANHNGSDDGGAEVIIESTHNEFDAIQILASDIDGGVVIEAGNGGIRLKSTGPIIQTQFNPFNIPNSDTTLTTSDLLSKILHGTPTANRNLTLPSVSNITNTIFGLQSDESFDFTIINQSASFSYSLITATNVGYSIVEPLTSGLFRIRLTGVTSTPDSYVLYRLA